MQAGIDEAGRGAVLGPLVVAGVACTDPDLPARLGCTDSKRLSPDRRRALDRALRAESSVRIVSRVISAETLDEERRRNWTLNAIEVVRFREIAALLTPTHLFLDAADVDAKRFGEQVGQGLEVPITSEHGADGTYPIVGAASIVAKVLRDKHVSDLSRRLERRLGLSVGSGYPSDVTTRAFLAGWFRAFGDWPEGTRTTWATLRDLSSTQTGLDRFGAHKP